MSFTVELSDLENACVGNAITYTASVVNPLGQTIRTLTRDDPTGATDNTPVTLKWNGRKDSGEYVTRGNLFTIDVSAQATCWSSTDSANEPTETNTVSFTNVKPTTGYLITHPVMRREGAKISSKTCINSSWNGCFTFAEGTVWWIQGIGNPNTPRVGVSYVFTNITGAYTCGVYVNWHTGPVHHSCSRVGRRVTIRVWVGNAAATIARVRVTRTVRRPI